MIQLAASFVYGGLLFSGLGVQDADARTADEWRELQESFLAGTRGAYEELVAGGVAAVPWLVEVLENPEAGMRQFMAANALGEIGAPECVPPLLDALDDPWFNVRRCAALALGEIGDLRAREPLEELAANDPFVYVDQQTGERKHLVRIDAREALLRLVKEPERFLDDASRPPPFTPPSGKKLAWPFAGKFRDQNLWNNYQQPTDSYVHAALDLMQDAGTEVHAVDAGRVALIATNYPDWTTHHFFIVEPEPGQGEGWCYTHVDPASYTFEVGDEVQAGDVLGSVVDFSLGENDGADHLHLHYVAFQQEGDGKVEFQSLYDPLLRFDNPDDQKPTIHTPFRLVRNRSLDEVDPDAVSGEVDVLVALSDNGYRGQAGNWGVPLVTIEITGKQAAPWRKLVLDQRGPMHDARIVKPLYLSYAQRKPFVEGLPPWPGVYVLKSTNTDGDGVIEASDERQCWNTLELDENGERRFPDGKYTLTVRAWDLAGNKAEEKQVVRVKND